MHGNGKNPDTQAWFDHADAVEAADLSSAFVDLTRTHGDIGDSAQRRAALVERYLTEAKRIGEGHAALIGQFMADRHK